MSAVASWSERARRMSETAKVYALWENVFGREYLPENRAIANTLVTSALLMCRSFLSPQSKARRSAAVRSANNSLAAFEGWLFDANLDMVGMIHLSPHDPPPYDRETFVQSLALVVGMARIMLTMYGLEGWPLGRSVNAFLRWLKLDDDEGANELLVRDMAQDGRNYLQILDGYDLNASRMAERKRDDSEVKAVNVPQSQPEAGAEKPQKPDELESASSGKNRPGASYDTSLPLHGIPQIALQAATVSAATAVSFRYEVLVDGTGDEGGSNNAERMDITNRANGGPTRGNTGSVADSYSYASPVRGLQLVVVMGQDGTMSCTLTESEGAALRSLHERVAQRLSRNMQQVLPRP